MDMIYAANNENAMLEEAARLYWRELQLIRLRSIGAWDMIEAARSALAIEGWNK